MTLKVGLMGFGRIGRNIFRILHENQDVQVKAIADIADHKSLEYLLKFDTILGRFPDTVSLEETGEGTSNLYTAGRQIKMVSGREPGDVNWKELDVDIVIEATAKYRGRAEMQKHLDAGAQRVFLCVPPSADEDEAPDRTIVMGFNHEALQPSDKVINNGSITSHCAAPIVKLINDAFGIERMFFTTINAYTASQRLADVPASDLRQGRAASENIIPSHTNTTAVIETLLPELAGKVSGLSLNVPVPNGSLIDMTMYTRKPLSVHAVNEVVRTGIDAHYSDIVEYSADPIVSSDVKHSPYSSTFDSLATTCMGENMVKTIAWYDNGWGYAHRVVDLVKYAAQQGGQS